MSVLDDVPLEAGDSSSTQAAVVAGPCSFARKLAGEVSPLLKDSLASFDN